MATCEYFLELLSAGLDGELTADEERELAEHLATCRECRTLAPRVAAAHAADTNKCNFHRYVPRF